MRRIPPTADHPRQEYEREEKLVNTNDPAPARSRRSILAGGAAAAVALLGQALGHPSDSRAADGSPLVLGADNNANHTTNISNNGTGNGVLYASATGSPISTAGAVEGSWLNGIGVYGTSNYNGVRGTSETGIGVLGLSNSSFAVRGESYSSAGVWGVSATKNGTEGHSSSASASGVYGENLQHGYGVAGRSNAHGLGVNGIFAAAALGENTADGIGVWARSQDGVGIYADAINLNTAIALKTRGVTQFDRSGKLTILAGHALVTKTGIRIDPGSLVLATLQQDRSGIYVRSAVPNATGDSFTIRLNKAVGSDTRVGWFIVN